MLRRVAQDEFEARHVFVLAGGVNDIAFDHQDRNPFMLLCDGRHIVKDETAQVHGQTEQGIEGCGLGKRAHHVAAPADEDSIEQRKRQNPGLQTEERPA